MLFAHINHLCFEVVSCIHDTKKIIVQSLVSFSISYPLSLQKQEKNFAYILEDFYCTFLGELRLGENWIV